MFKSVKSLVLSAVLLVAGAIVGTFAVTEIGARNVKANIEELQSAANEIAGPQLELVRTIKDIQINVIEVQQWLTDISATRGLDGLNDGLDIAAEQAQAFLVNIARARDLAQRLGNTDILEPIASAEKNFPVYYEAGRVMAQKYIYGGPSGGNPYMAAFDEEAERLGADLELMLDANRQHVEEIRGTLHETSELSNSALTMMQIVVIGFSFASLVTVIMLQTMISKSVVKPIAQSAAVMRELSNGKSGGKIDLKSKLSEIVDMETGLREFQETYVKQLASSQAMGIVSTPIVVLDSGGEVIVANEAFETLWTKNAERLGNLRKGEGSVSDDNFLPLMREMESAKEAGQTLSKADGGEALEIFCSNLILEVRSFPIMNGDKVVGTAVTTTDATDIRGLEQGFLNVIDNLKNGELTDRIGWIDDMGFTSHAARGFNELMETVHSFLAQLSKSVQALSKGDLTVSMDGEFLGLFDDAKNDFNSGLKSVRSLVDSIGVAVTRLELDIVPIVSGAKDLAQRTESQAASIEETNATMTEIRDDIQKNSAIAKSTVELGSTAVTHAEDGGIVVSETIAAVSRIDAGSTAINDIVNVIDKIAFQTNLLALNAAVEAARAGEAGKGFAVVASEVRQLAQDAGDSAKQIRDLVEASSAHVKDGVRLTQGTGETFEKLIVAAQSVAEKVNELSQFIGNQSSRISEISEAVHEMDNLTQSNAQVAETSASSAGRLLEQAAALSASVKQFVTRSEATGKGGAKFDTAA